MKEELCFNFSFLCESLHLLLSFNEGFTEPQELQTNSERFAKAAEALLSWDHYFILRWVSLCHKEMQL